MKFAVTRSFDYLYTQRILINKQDIEESDTKIKTLFSLWRDKSFQTNKIFIKQNVNHIYLSDLRIMSETAINSKNSEFTPIGYLSNKRRKISTSEDIKSPSAKYDNNQDTAELSFDENDEKQGNENYEFRNDVDDEPSRKLPKSTDDDTINSNVLFTENSQFDDTLPELPDVYSSSTNGKQQYQDPKNLLPNLNDATISEPIKEQQELTKLLLSGKRLSNAQTNFFLQYLKNSNIFSQPNESSNKTSVDQERYNALYNDYQVLQRKFSDLADSNNIHMDDNSDEESIHDECEKKQEKLNRQIESYKKELDILKSQHQKKIQELNDENTKLEEEKKTQLSNSNNKDSEYDDKINRLNDTIDKLNDDLRQKEKKYNSEILNLENKLANLKNSEYDSIGRLEAQIISKDNKISNLENQLDQLNIQHDSIKSKFEDANRALESKQHECDDYKLKIDLSEEHNQKFTSESNRKAIHEYEDQIATLKEEKDDQTQKLLSCQKKMNELDTALNTLKEKHKYEVQHLNDSITKLSSNKKENLRKTENLQEEIDKKNKEISQNVFMIKNLKEKLQNLERKDDYSSRNIKQELNVKIDEISQLSKKVKELEDTIEKTDEKVRHTTDNSRNLEQELREARNNIIEINKLLTSSKDNIEQKQIALDQANKAIEILNEKIGRSSTETDSQLDILNLRLEEQTEKLHKSEETNKKLHDQIIQGAVNSASKVSKEIESKDKHIQKLEEKSEEYREQMAVTKRTLEKYKELLQELKDPNDKQIETQKAEIRRLKLQLQVITEERETLRNQLSTLRERNKLFQKRDSESLLETANLLEENNEIRNLNIRLNELQNKSNELKSLNEEQIVQIDDLLRQRKLLNDNYSMLKNLNSEYMKEIQTLKDDRLVRENDVKETILDLENKNMKLNDILDRERYTNESRSRDADLRDYYRLKYHREVRHNNALRLINYYMDRVSKRTSTQMKMDYRKYNRILSNSKKFEESLNDYDYIPDRRYDTSDFKYNLGNDLENRPNRFDNNGSPLYYRSPRLRFKTLARFVQACVRMKQIALKNHWDEQRLKHLERRIDSADSNINWSL